MPSTGLPADARPNEPGDPIRRLTPASHSLSSSDPQAVLTRCANSLGFAEVGVAPVDRFQHAYAPFKAWLARGFAGQMEYLRSVDDRIQPRNLLPEAKTLIVVALPYASPNSQPPFLRPGPAEPHGIIAAYAKGEDYHRVVKTLLWAMAQGLSDGLGQTILARAVVDTAPLLEREAARLSGMAFTGKNTLSIVPGLGSYFVLGELLVDVEIPPFENRIVAGCGQCRRCLDACPTGAFIDAYQLDSRRCISYLTIEYRGIIPIDLRPLMGLHVFGCDICQNVCPYNKTNKALPLRRLSRLPRLDAPNLVTLLQLRSGAFRRWVRGTALTRVSRTRLARNAAVALGNSGDPSVVSPLRAALQNHVTLVRGHAAWALGRLPTGTEAPVHESLRKASESDVDAWVREEARLALKQRLTRQGP